LIDARQRVDRLVLAEHHALERLFEMFQNLGIVLRHALGRNPRHGRDRRLDFLDADGLSCACFSATSICAAPDSSITSIALSGSLRSWM